MVAITAKVPRLMKFEKSKALQDKVHAVIPGGAHVYAKGDDQYPVLAPGFIARGAGCHVWDLDGNEFIEYGMGLRAVSLGHAYSPWLRCYYRSSETRPRLHWTGYGCGLR